MSEFEYTVRKYRVVGKLSDLDWNRLMLEFDIQHRNKNKFISIDQARRNLVRQAQAEHPTIGMLTAEYNKLKGETSEIIRDAQMPFDKQLTVINARIRDAKQAKEPVTELVNKRKAIEKERKQAGKEASGDLSDQLAKLAEQLRQVKEQSRSQVNKIRDRAKPIKEALETLTLEMAEEDDADALAVLVEKRKKLKERLRDIKDEANEQDIYGAINQHTEQLKKLACRDMSDEEAHQYGFMYGAAGHSGTKWWVKENAEQAAKTRGKDMSEAKDPKFRRFQPDYLTGEIREGTLCAGISQSGPSGVLASYDSPNKSKLFIPSPPPSSAYDKTLRRCDRKRAQRADVYFRIGTVKVLDEQTNKMVEKPEWIHLPNVGFHHEFPRGAVVVEALLKMEAVGAHRKLFIIFTLKAAPEKPIVPETMEAVHIKAETQIGDGALVYAQLDSAIESRPLWHSTDPCQRIRKWPKLGKTSGVRRDENGNLRQYVNGQVSSKKITDLYTYSEGILRTQTDWLTCLPDGKSRPTSEGGERQGSRFATVVLGYIASGANLPPCLEQAARNDVFHWRSTGKLQRLYRRWRHERVDGDEEAFEAMREWADHDLHLYQWGRSMLARLTRRKVDTFRKEALKICRTYKTVYIDDIDSRGREEGYTEDQASERTKWEKRAGFGLFREILRKTAKRCGTELIEGLPDSSIAA